MASREIPETLVKGAVVAGKYRVDKILGVGGMAAVASATHVLLDEKVALKCLLPVLSDDPALKTRFMREAKASIALRSEHVVRVHDVGELESGEPFIVMELLDGRDLDKLARMGSIPVPDVVAFMIQTAEALAEAHARGIIHRDIKPANLFATTAESGERCIKVLDFGISRVADQVALTSVGHVMGSAHYMSPEQIGGAKDLDERADVYSLGITAYELLGGERPFKGSSVVEVSLQVVEKEPTPLAKLRPELDPRLVAVVARAHAKDRAARFATMVELGLALAPFASAEADAALAKLRRRATRAAADIVANVRSSLASLPEITREREVPRAAADEPKMPALPPPRATVPLPPPRATISSVVGPADELPAKGGISTVTGVIVAALGGVAAAFGIVYSGVLGAPAPPVTVPDAKPEVARTEAPADTARSRVEQQPAAAPSATPSLQPPASAAAPPPPATPAAPAVPPPVAPRPPPPGPLAPAAPPPVPPPPGPPAAPPPVAPPPVAPPPVAPPPAPPPPAPPPPAAPTFAPEAL